MVRETVNSFYIFRGTVRDELKFQVSAFIQVGNIIALQRSFERHWALKQQAVQLDVFLKFVLKCFLL